MIRYRADDLFLELYTRIPVNVRELLWLLGEGFTNIMQDALDEPSLIDINLKIIKPEDSGNKVNSLDYGPSYSYITSEQRYIYLKWLQDITQPIDIGYVFLFYYGLERHLLYGKFEASFKIIAFMRRFHRHSSFMAYSFDALYISAVFNKRIELMLGVELDNINPVISALVNGLLEGYISADNLIGLSKYVGFNRIVDINSEPQLFKSIMERLLTERFGEPCYYVAKSDFEECKSTVKLALANNSFRMHERYADMPDITSNPNIKNDILMLLNHVCKEMGETKSIVSNKNRPEIKTGKISSPITNGYEDVLKDYDIIIKNIKYSTSPHIDIPIAQEEEIFFKELIKRMKSHNLFYEFGLQLTRLADKTFNVYCNKCYIGKIKLQGKKKYIQVLLIDSDVKIFNNITLEDSMGYINQWLEYMKSFI